MDDRVVSPLVLNVAKIPPVPEQIQMILHGIFPTKFSSCFYSLLQEANMHYVENCGNYGPPTKGTIMYIVREPDIISNLPHFVKKNRCSTLWGHSKSVTDKNEKV